jgi:hypothetical protein
MKFSHKANTSLLSSLRHPYAARGSSLSKTSPSTETKGSAATVVAEEEECTPLLKNIRRSYVKRGSLSSSSSSNKNAHRCDGNTVGIAGARRFRAGIKFDDDFYDSEDESDNVLMDNNVRDSGSMPWNKINFGITRGKGCIQRMSLTSSLLTTDHVCCPRHY